MFVFHQNLNIYFSFCRQLFLTETMVAAILKMYFFGTALSVLAVLYEIADSVGGLMHVQDHHYLQELNQQTERDISSNNWGGRPVTKNIGSWEDRHVVVFGHVLQLSGRTWNVHLCGFMVQMVLSVWALFCSPLSAVMSCSSYCVKPLLNTEHIPCVKSTHFVYIFLSKVNENIGGFLMNVFDVCKFIAACRSQSTRCAFRLGSDPATELGVQKRNAGCHKTNRS